MINHSYSCGLTPREKKLNTPFNGVGITKQNLRIICLRFENIEKFVYLFIFFFSFFLSLHFSIAFHSYASLKIDL